jgi:16S rRNA (guanine527-N7)-methyltransferase
VNALPSALRAVLQDAQRAGAIGPGSLDDAVAHSRGFVHGIAPLPGWHCVDLGSGGGLPGLPLALELPDTQWTLIDAWAARVDALARAIVQLALEPRVAAIHGRAEELGRGSLRGRADLVVARAFGPPALTAECAAPLLRPGGLLVVSASRAPDAWPAAGVPALSLVAWGTWEAGGGFFRAFQRAGDLAARFPRRPPAQARRPLF